MKKTKKKKKKKNNAKNKPSDRCEFAQLYVFFSTIQIMSIYYGKPFILRFVLNVGLFSQCTVSRVFNVAQRQICFQQPFIDTKCISKNAGYVFLAHNWKTIFKRQTKWINVRNWWTEKKWKRGLLKNRAISRSKWNGIEAGKIVRWDQNCRQRHETNQEKFKHIEME